MVAAQIEQVSDFMTKALEADVVRLALVMALVAIGALVLMAVMFSRVAMRLNKTQSIRDTSEALHQERLLKLLENNTAANTKLADTLAMIDANSRTERDTWHKLIEGQGANVGKIATVVEGLSKAITEQFDVQHATLDGVTGQVGGLKTALAANTAQITTLTETLSKHTEIVGGAQLETRQIVSDSWDKVLNILQDVHAMMQEQSNLVKRLVEAKADEKPEQSVIASAGTAGSTVGVDVDDRAAAGADQSAGDGAGRSSDPGSVRDEHATTSGSDPDSTAG